MVCRLTISSQQTLWLQLSKQGKTNAAGAADAADVELVVQESVELNVPASPASKTPEAKKSSPKGKRGSGRASIVNHKGEVLPENPLIRPTKFRAGVLQMVLQDQDKTEQLRIKVVAQVSHREVEDGKERKKKSSCDPL